MGADAYATGDHVVLGRGTDLHTVAHEAAHVVQQRGGVQLKGGVGAAGDPYEHHADAIADAVVAGRSAESLLDRGAAGGATHAVQRKEASDDAKLLENQASLKGTDVEIPVLEGALLATRQEAVKRGLLSQASFSAGLALSQAMTQLQPAVAAKGSVDKRVQEGAAVAAQRLYTSLQHETADEKNFKVQPAMDESTAITAQNPYTNESRLTTGFLIWSKTRDIGSWFEKLPALIRQGEWDDAFRGYRSMIDGLDLWVADQLRAKGKGTPEEALGNAHQHYAQLRTGLEVIADKHAKRLPALFHPDPKTVASEKAAGRPTADAIPLNVYFWKDAADGTYHLYDLTTPGYPREQTIDGEPTAARMNTFFEDVARYPEGNVQYTLPSGGGGVAPTTGKIKWYEWVGYAGMALAAVGLAALTAGASIPATVCFAAGALAGGISAVGHLADSAQLGTATTTTVVIDIAQIVASFASFGAMSITVKAGSAAVRSGYFVSFVGGAAAGDVVQLIALSKETVDQLDVIYRNHGTADDQQRAASVLIAQLLVTTGLTALSVQGARNLRVPHGPPLELVEQNGVNMLRVLGEDTPVLAGESKRAPGVTHEPPVESKTAPGVTYEPPVESKTTTGDIGTKPMSHDGHGSKSPDSHGPKRALHAETGAPTAGSQDLEYWLVDLEHSLNPEEKAKLTKMSSGKTPQQVRDMLGGDLAAARERVRRAVRIDQDRAAIAVQSKERIADMREKIEDRGLMNDPEIRAIVDGTTVKDPSERMPALRDKLVAKLSRTEAEHANPGAEVLDSIEIYEKLPEANLADWHAKNPGKVGAGLTERTDGLYIRRGEIDMMVVARQSSGKARIIAREEIKTGTVDTHSKALAQLDDQTALLGDGAAGKKVVRLEMLDRDITAELDLQSDASARKSTRGPAAKGFNESLGVSAGDLERMCKELLAEATAAGKQP